MIFQNKMIDVCQILRQFDDDDSAVTLSNYKIFSFQSFHAEVHQYKSRIEEFNNLTQVRSQKKIRKRKFHPWMIIYQEEWLEQFGTIPTLNIFRSWFHPTRLTTLRRSRKLPKASTKGYKLLITTYNSRDNHLRPEWVISRNLTNFTK